MKKVLLFPLLSVCAFLPYLCAQNGHADSLKKVATTRNDTSLVNILLNIAEYYQYSNRANA